MIICGGMRNASATMPATAATAARMLMPPISGQAAARSSVANAAKSTPACARLAAAGESSAGKRRVRTVAKDMVGCRLLAYDRSAHGLFDRLFHLRRRLVGRLAPRAASDRFPVRDGHPLYGRSLSPPRD